MTRSIAASCLVLASALLAGPSFAEPVTPWARDGTAEMRMVDAGPADEPGARLAAIEIRLDAGWKTYWRQPGDSGVPPRFDFSASRNLAEATVEFPAPERAEDPEGVTNVYHGLVTLPVTVRAKDPAQPVSLALTADYGVCEKVCVPSRAELSLELSPRGGMSGPAAMGARLALDKAPKALPLGAHEPLAVVSAIRGAPQDGKPTIEVDVAAPGGVAAPELFAETGEGGYAPAPEQVGEAKDGRARFRLQFAEPDLPKSGLRLTLVAGGRAIETAVALDAIAPTP